MAGNLTADTAVGFSYLGWWVNLDLARLNEELAREGKPHVHEVVNTTVRELMFEQQTLFLAVLSKGLVVLNCSGWGAPTWVAVDGFFYADVSACPSANYTAGFLRVLLTSTLEVGWARTSAPAEEEPASPAPESPPGVPLWAGPVEYAYAAVCFILSVVNVMVFVLTRRRR